MEENVALDSEKKKKFLKSIKGIQKLLKSGEIEVDENVKPETAIKKKKSKKRKEKGLVYLSHIPHGFYEKEMTEYFKQFGGVTNVRVIRSKHTGKSKGHAFVEFANLNVAQIVAETMNNYLMGKRLLKAAYIPPEKQRRASRRNWNASSNPGCDSRRKMKKVYNKDKTDKEELKKSRHILKNLSKTKLKLSEMGIDYNFFNPVDVPQDLIQKKEDNNSESEKSLEAEDNSSQPAKVKENKVKKQNKIVKNDTTDKKPMGDFVKITNGNEESSDESYVFDSDEYEKQIGEDEESDSDFNEPSSNISDEDVSVNSRSEEENKNRPNMLKKVKMVLPKHAKSTQFMKRKAPNETRKPKKAKLEKPIQKQKLVIKKKK